MVVKELRRRVVYMVALVSCAALFLVCQVRLPLHLDVGTGADHDFVSDFNEQEHIDGLSYRWSCGRSTLRFRGVATWTPVQLTLRLNGSRPAGLCSPYVVIVANGREVGPLQTTDQFETYCLRLPPDMLGIWGDLAVEIHCDAFIPAEVTGADDQRELGVLVDSAAVVPFRDAMPVILPPLRQYLSLVLAAAAAYLWGRQLAFSRERALFVAAILLSAIAALMIRWPMRLGLYDQWLLAFLTGANVATILGRSLRSRLSHDRHLSPEAIIDLKLLLTVALISAAGVYVWKGLWRPLREDRATDFFINYTAATVLVEGGDIYDPATLREASRRWEEPTTTFDFGSLFVTYISPPLHALMLLPLVPLGYEKARLVFAVSSNLLLFSSLALILCASDRALLRSPRFLLALMIVLLFQPIYTSLALGQVDFVILFLISLSYWAYLTDRKLVVGPALAVAAMIKLSPAVLLLYFLWKREFSVVVSAALAGILGTILSIAVVGPQAVVQFATEILPALLKGTAFFQNQSLNGFFSRLLVDPTLDYSLQELPSVPAVRVLTLLSSLSLVVVVAYLTRPQRDASGLRFPYEFALVLGTLFLVSSISWDHYTIWLLPGFVVLLHPSLSVRLSRARHATVLACAWCAYLLMIIPTGWYGMALHAQSSTQTMETVLTLLMSLKVYAALLFCSGLALLLVSLHSEKRPGAAPRAGAEVF